MNILACENLYKKFKLKGQKFFIHAVEDFSLKVSKSDFFALVGESGSGKSTVARILLGLIKPEQGRVIYKDKDLFNMSKENVQVFRRSVQIVFQDPYSSLNPRMRIYSIIEEPLKVHKKIFPKEAKFKILEIIKKMGLTEDVLYKYPHQLSGGQRQRIAIARALILEPEILIADEPLSSLDISVQASLLNFLDKMQREKEFGILFITHDLNLVRAVSNYVAVMHLGRIVEQAETKTIFSNPLHPYTKILIQSIPGFHRRKREKRLKNSETEENLNPWMIDGCRFYTRCPYRMSICKDTPPPLKNLDGRLIRCFLF